MEDVVGRWGGMAVGLARLLGQTDPWGLYGLAPVIRRSIERMFKVTRWVMHELKTSALSALGGIY